MSHFWFGFAAARKYYILITSITIPFVYKLFLMKPFRKKKEKLKNWMNEKKNHRLPRRNQTNFSFSVLTIRFVAIKEVPILLFNIFRLLSFVCLPGRFEHEIILNTKWKQKKNWLTKKHVRRTEIPITIKRNRL